VELARSLRPDLLVVDSIQTATVPDLDGAAGSVGQVRESALRLMGLAKGEELAVVLVGHVTKEGSIAGPKALEHIVDTVLYFEGDRHHNHRIIRATKNRFGAANEIGIFEMTNEGLKAVGNPSEVFLQERPEGANGSVVTVCMEGTRPMLVEVQALVTGTKFGTGRRMAQGFDYNRTSLLIAVLEKRLGFQLAGDDVFVNVAGGLEIDEPAADLGVIAAISSSFRNLQIPPDTAVFGEVGLTGEVRGVLQAQSRAREAQTLGFKKLILPASNRKGLEKLLGIRVVGVRNLEEALDELF
jgi:DNA repair protein RadA/Sms